MERQEREVEGGGMQEENGGMQEENGGVVKWQEREVEGWLNGRRGKWRDG